MRKLGNGQCLMLHYEIERLIYTQITYSYLPYSRITQPGCLLFQSYTLFLRKRL